MRPSNPASHGLSRGEAADYRLVEPLGAVIAGWLDRGSRPSPHRPPVTWHEVVAAWWAADPAARRLVQSVEQRQAAGACIYPADPFRALDLTPLERVRVIILGQDPYHGPGQAQGLAFSVASGMPIPPSLRNILAEVRRDLGHVSARAETGDLSGWAEQGVLLLNTCLTVEDGQAGAHAKFGWASLTGRLIAAVAQQARSSRRPLVAMLWGLPAQRHRAALQSEPAAQAVQADSPATMILESNHPSPLSARRPPVPFLGCGHFSRAREFLATHSPDDPPISW